MPYPLPSTLYLYQTLQARLARRTACGSHVSLRLASPVERPAARTSHSDSPRPSNGLRLALPPHEAEVVHGEAAAQAEDGDDDRQAHRDLSRGHRHHEEHHGLAVGGPQSMTERHEREVCGVEHQLDRHEDHEGVAAH